MLTIPVLASLLAATPAPASTPLEGGWTTGSTGALGDVVYGLGEHVIDLAVEGVYDPVAWCVVFDFQTLTVDPNATIRFSNHPSCAPVVWRATGDITLAGQILLHGETGHSLGQDRFSEPGPGGFRGGRARRDPWLRSAGGFGPGGGFLSTAGTDAHGGHGSHATDLPWGAGPTYGSPALLPLIGGSGGGGGNTNTTGWWAMNTGGGAGGGALLIGSDTRIDLAGAINADGGSSTPDVDWGGKGGFGSGGAIRVVAPIVTQVVGTGPLSARGPTHQGPLGRIRIETDGDPGQQFWTIPEASYSWTLGPFLPELPRVTLQSWWDEALEVWVPIAQDPSAEIQPPAAADVQLPDAGVRTVRLEGHDVPLGAVLHVRVVGTEGAQVVLDSTHTMGEVAGSTLALSWTDVPIDFSHGVTAVQVRAELP